MHVIGTAGHVDHGKSTLVEKLTGIDPDRLREEKQRGMTIDLGFAWLRLPNGNEVSIVDVPGHERFVNNMLAGVGGIDLALLVVAADESVMPQTREHLAILDLLQVQRGLVAITKRDLMDEDWVEMVAADVEDALEGTTLAGSPILSVSGTTGQGLPELVSAIESLLEDTQPRRDLGRPRLPIDRSFTISGFGTVVTGTLMDGTLGAGQEVELAPSGVTTRIRGLQSHKQVQDRVEPGTRVAANLAGIAHGDIDRGEVLTTPGWLRPTTALDVRLKVIEDAPRAIRHNMFATVHVGSSETVARVRLLEGETAQPGETTWAQLKLDHPRAIVKGDYFVIRSNHATLGGGNVVDPQARRHRRNHQPLLNRLAVMEKGTDREVLTSSIEASEPAEFQDLANRANLDAAAVRSELKQMAVENLAVLLGKKSIGPGLIVFTAAGWSALRGRAEAFLDGYHRQFPLRRGAPKEELRSRLGMGQQTFGHALTRLQQDGALVDEGREVRRPDHVRKLSVEQQGQADRYLALLRTNPYSPPTDDPVDADVLGVLVDEGKVVRVSESVVFDADAYEDMVAAVRKRTAEAGQITVADVRDMLGATRKYALALLEYLDQERITQRVGDARVLR